MILIFICSSRTERIDAKEKYTSNDRMLYLFMFYLKKKGTTYMYVHSEHKWCGSIKVPTLGIENLLALRCSFLIYELTFT